MHVRSLVSWRRGVVLKSIGWIELPESTKTRVEDGEKGKRVAHSMRPGSTRQDVIVLRVGISHPSHNQVKYTVRTHPPTMKNGVDDIVCVYMRLPGVELSQDLSCPPTLTGVRSS